MEQRLYRKADIVVLRKVRHGDTVSLTASPDPCLFARVQERAYFTSTLMNRLRRSE